MIFVDNQNPKNNYLLSKSMTDLDQTTAKPWIPLSSTLKTKNN